MLKNEYKNASLNPDKPIELASDSDKLSFSKLVDSLIDLIKLPQPPFTFGIFGKWGTGKSTILREVEKRLDGNGYYVVTFDAWKYEGDALRRSFLSSIARQLNEKYEDRVLLPDKKVVSDKFVKELEDDIYKVRNEPTVKSNLTWWKILLLAGIFTILLAAQIAVVLANPESNVVLGIAPLTLAFAMGLATFIVSTVSPSAIGKLLVKEINIGTDKLSSPEEFHTKFLSILKNTGDKTLLVIIDNLDRTQKDATIQLLGTIKTFLNSDRGKENVVFLVAADHKAIKRHIKDIYADNLEDAYEAEEFIKKFFNAVVEVPPFVSSEYREYLIDLIEESGIKTLSQHKEDIVSIVSAGYPENPRGAKHFINSLVIYLVMLSSIGDGSGVEQEFIEQNLNFIATMLVIRDRFDEIYDYIQEQSLKYEHSWNDIKQEASTLYSPDSSKVSKAKQRDFQLFYNSVESWIDPSEGSLKWYFNMRRSKEEQQLANWDPFVSSVDKKDQEQAVKYLGEFYEKPDILDKLLQQHAANIKNEVTRWIDFCTTFMYYLTKINPDAAEKLQGAVREVFRYFPTNGALRRFADQVDFNRLLHILENDFIKASEKARVRASINYHIRAGDASVEDLLGIIDYEIAVEHSNSSTLNAIAAYTDSHSNFTESTDLLRKLTELDEKNSFTTLQSTKNVVQSIDSGDSTNLETLESKLAYIGTTKSTTPEIANKYIDLFHWLQNGGNKDTRSVASFYLSKLLTIPKNNIGIIDSNGIRSIAQYAANWYHQNRGDHVSNRNIIVLLMQLTQQELYGYAQNIRNIIQEYFGSADTESIVYTLNNTQSDNDNRHLIIDKLKERILNDTTLLQRIKEDSSNWPSEEDLASIAFYLVANAPNLSTEHSFMEVIDLSANTLKDIDYDNSAYESKLYEAFIAATPKFTEAVAKYVNKRKDNLLNGHSDWLLDLKHKVKEAKTTK